MTTTAADGRIRSLALTLATLFATFGSSLAAVPPPAPRLKGAPAGDLVEVPGLREKAEVVRFEAALAEGLLKIGLERPVAVSDFPVAPGERASVLLTRRDVYAPDAEIWEVGEHGRRRVPRSNLVFLWGEAEGDPDVRLMVSVDPATRSLYGYAITPDGAFEVQPVPESWHAGTGYVVGSRDLFLDKAAQAAEKGWTCGQEALEKPLDWLVGGNAPPPAKAGGQGLEKAWEKAGISALHTATIAVDTDNELMHLKFSNNNTSATNYIAGLIAAMNVMYERDLLVRMVQGFTILRPSPGGNPTNYTTDPYSQGCGSPCGANSSQLNEFSNYWAGGCAGGCTGVNRALAMMLSGKQASNNSASGIAWVNGLCSSGIGYSFSQVFKFAGSTGASDSKLVGHEIGHNFGSPHTHCYSPPIDNCFNSEGGCYSGATSCPASTTYNGVTNVRGTVMSYCHILGGCSASEVFHPATVDRLDDIILSKTTGLGACIFPFVAPGPAVTAVTPNTGTTAGGTPVTITGTGFAAGATVTFDTGGGAAAATGVVVVNATTITATAPAHATGAVRVTVANPAAGSGFKDNAYFYAPPPAAAGFYTLTPCRIFDTRNAAGPLGGPSLAANATRLFTVTGVCGIPAGAKAISVNVTVVPLTTDAGSFTLYPGNAFPMGTTNLNFSGGKIRAGASILILATNGGGTIGVQNASPGAQHVLVDVNGYFQ